MFACTNLIAQMTLSTTFRYCCFFLLLTVAKGFCQENYAFRWYTADNNELPQSSIKAIVADKYNFIWMTTENGLVRYDGNTFTAYNSSNTNLQGSRFTDIFGSVEKDSLVCYNEGKKELAIITGRKIKVIQKKPPIYNYNRKGRHSFLHDGLPSYLTIDPSEQFCIKTSNGNIFFVDNDEVELCDAKMKRLYKIAYKNNSVFNFFAIGNTLFYLSDNGNYDSFSISGKTSGQLDPKVFKTKPKIFWNITTGQIFLSFKNKIYLVEFKNGKLSAKFIVEFNDFVNSNIASIYYDQSNQKLYLGSNTNGLCIITFPAFKSVKKEFAKSEAYYAAQAFTDSTIITPIGLIFDNKKLIDSLSFEKIIDLNEKITIAQDEQKNIWLSRRNNVLCYLKNSGYKKYITYRFNQNPKTIFCDNENNIWVSLAHNEFQKPKLYCIKNGKIHLIALFDANINFIAEYDAETLYLGTEKGLFRYEKNSRKLFFIKSTNQINIRSIFIDHERKIWLTTYEKGFFLYSSDRKHLHSFPKDEDEYLNSSHSITEDKNGFFWVPTNKGLFQISRKALLAYLKDKSEAIYYHQYNKADGFLTNEFNGGCQPSSNFLKNGNIVLPSINGFVFFNPYKVRPLLPGKQLYIDRVIVDQKEQQPSDIIVLPNGFQRVSILIAYPYYGNPENLHIEAKLEKNANSRWERIKNERSISFTTLPPGEYKLMIRSLSGFDSKYVYKKILLKVPAKFYQTVWFTALTYVLLIGFLISLWYIRLYYIKRKNIKLKEVIDIKTKKLATTVKKLQKTKSNLKQEIKQQETLVKSISHDIKSPLKFLTNSITHLFENETIQEDAQLKKHVGTIKMSTTQLYEYVENLIKYSSIFIEGKKLEDDSYSLYNLIEEKIDIFEKIAEAENIEVINSVDPKLRIRTNKKALSIIIHNLVDNAIKNAPNGHVELFSGTKDNILLITIIDNGKGMSKELIDYYLDFYKNPIVKNYHLGLHMIIELLLIIHGNINITSTEGKGTAIEIMVEYD
ncbi:ATP-binding protein [Flavobacterium sp. KACC 22761]|uniref:ligand-binding sensor domain-containing protein n=1 Tax=Flavobacterium sp. KACC 22761 TaxID=3092665 RepID=UPI002A765EF7|nr:ATP-binding protein [Flavobacterium sp. KACC 22761]WPO78890.1 ATP-binding protein [Flavobacterium sp. KACC 22761]